MDKVPQKMVSVNLIYPLFTLVDFLTFEDGASRFSQNVGKELPLCAA
jgi:hypothetical protein